MRKFMRNWAAPGVLFGWALIVYLNSLFRDPPFRETPGRFLDLLSQGAISFPLTGSVAVAVFRMALVLTVVVGIGALFCRRLGIRHSRAAFLPTALGIGVALVAVPLEILGIGFLFSRWSVIGALALAAGIAGLPWRRFLGEPKRLEEEPSEKRPVVERLFGWTAAALIVLISLFTFYHAVLFPVVYWDSLIYYEGYARQTYEAGGFPIKVTAQVGLGIGANYPHLFHSLQNVPAEVFGEWSDVHGQLLPPILGVLATLLVYGLAFEIWGSRLLALLGALLFRSIPYGTCYFINASDYALAVFFVALFLYLAWSFYRDRSPSRLLLLGLSASAAAKVNYLMPFLSVFFFVMVGADLLRRSSAKKSRKIVVAAVCILLASTWCVRNWIVAGNPIYPYFPEVFGGQRIDMQVLRSCEVEWMTHGDGIGRFGDDVWEKVWAAPRFFMMEAPNYHWKLWPIFVGFWLPGLMIFFVDRGPSSRGEREGESKEGAVRRTLWLSVAVALFVLYYHFGVSSFYYYHMIPFIPAVTLIGCVVLRRLLRSPFIYLTAPLVLISGVVPGLAMSLIGPKVLAPGLHHLSASETVSLSGTPANWLRDGQGRITTAFYPDERNRSLVVRAVMAEEVLPRDFVAKVGREEAPLAPALLRGREADGFLLRKFGGEYLMFVWLPALLPSGARLLTHENRHLYLPRDVEIVHLDEWDLSQNYYGAPWDNLRRYLMENDIRYYLKVPYEEHHPILKRLGLDETLDSEWKEVARWETIRRRGDREEVGAAVLYELRGDGEAFEGS